MPTFAPNNHIKHFKRNMEDRSRHTFDTWPTDLLIDYAIKIHHRGIRTRGPLTLELLGRVKAERPLVLSQVEQLFAASLEALDAHLFKEENVLFPYIEELHEAASNHQAAAPMHCGTVLNPIHVMMADHAEELQRQATIAALLDDYNEPEGCSDDYKRLMHELREFALDLQEHTHIENDLIFPQAVEMESKWVNGCNGGHCCG